MADVSTMTSIAENLERVRVQIAQTAAKVGRAVDEIELVAISKTHDAVKVREAIEAGAPDAVDVSSRVEVSPGRKDPELVRRFVSAALGCRTI